MKHNQHHFPSNCGRVSFSLGKRNRSWIRTCFWICVLVCVEAFKNSLGTSPQWPTGQISIQKLNSNLDNGEALLALSERDKLVTIVWGTSSHCFYGDITTVPKQFIETEACWKTVLCHGLKSVGDNMWTNKSEKVVIDVPVLSLLPSNPLSLVLNLLAEVSIRFPHCFKVLHGILSYNTVIIPSMDMSAFLVGFRNEVIFTDFFCF